MAPAGGIDRARVPGERSLGAQARYLAEGIEIDDPLYAELLGFAD